MPDGKSSYGAVTYLQLELGLHVPVGRASSVPTYCASCITTPARDSRVTLLWFRKAGGNAQPHAAAAQRIRATNWSVPLLSGAV